MACGADAGLGLTRVACRSGIGVEAGAGAATGREASPTLPELLALHACLGALHAVTGAGAVAAAAAAGQDTHLAAARGALAEVPLLPEVLRSLVGWCGQQAAGVAHASGGGAGAHGAHGESWKCGGSSGAGGAVAAAAALAGGVRGMVAAEVGCYAAALLSGCYGQLGLPGAGWGAQQQQQQQERHGRWQCGAGGGGRAGGCGGCGCCGAGSAGSGAAGGVPREVFGQQNVGALPEFDDVAFTFGGGGGSAAVDGSSSSPSSGSGGGGHGRETGAGSGSEGREAPAGGGWVAGEVAEGAVGASAALVAAGCPALAGRLLQALVDAGATAGAGDGVQGGVDGGGGSEGGSGSDGRERGAVLLVGWPRRVQVREACRGRTSCYAASWRHAHLLIQHMCFGRHMPKIVSHRPVPPVVRNPQARHLEYSASTTCTCFPNAQVQLGSRVPRAAFTALRDLLASGGAQLPLAPPPPPALPLGPASRAVSGRGPPGSTPGSPSTGAPGSSAARDVAALAAALGEGAGAGMCKGGGVVPAALARRYRYLCTST